LDEIPGLKFMILSSTDLRVPSDENVMSGLPKPPSTVTFCRYLENKQIFGDDKMSEVFHTTLN
jgi:hypothetical protein